MQETLDLLLEFSGDRYPRYIVGKKTMADAAKIIDTQTKLLLQSLDALGVVCYGMRPQPPEALQAISNIRAYLAQTNEVAG